MNGKLRSLFFFTLLLLNAARGDIWQDVTVAQDSQICDIDQYVRVFVHDTAPNMTHLMVTGGQIGTFYTYDTSITEICGGTFSMQYYAYHPANNDGDNLCLCPSSSRLYAYNQSTIIYRDGQLQDSVGKAILCTDSSHLIVNGGECGISAIKNSSVDIYNGTITGITTATSPYDIIGWEEANTIFCLRGGIYTGNIFLTSYSQMYIYGYDFNYNSQTHKLTGLWQDGSQIEITFTKLFSVDSYDRVVLVEVPEPSTFLFISLTGLSVFAHRKNR